MLSIRNNPYRIIGVLVGTSAKDQLSRLRKLKMYIEAEQEPDEDFSFPSLGPLSRTVETVDGAGARLNLGNDRVHAAIFWFFNDGIADEPAFDSLKAGDLDTAAAAWEKLTASADITQRNFSAAQNLSTLLLNQAFQNGQTTIKALERGILLKLRFLESDLVGNFVRLAADETYKAAKEDLQINFLNAVFAEAKKNGVSEQQLVAIIENADFSVKPEFLKNFAQQPISEVERLIEETKKSRKSQPDKAAEAGIALFNQAKGTLDHLRAMLGSSDIKFTSLSDKVAEEVLQCGIDHFKHFRDTDTDPGHVTMDCVSRANSLAIGNIAKQRCQENLTNLQEWIDDKPNREKHTRVAKDLERIRQLIDEFGSKPQNVANARALVMNAQGALSNIRTVLGVHDELYLGVCSRIGSDAQGMMVNEINAVQATIGRAHDNATKVAGIILLKHLVDSAWEVTLMIEKMDLRSDFRSNLMQNRGHLNGLRNQLSQVSGSAQRQQQSNDSACYIATMAYGRGDHPQVVALRAYRDSVLAHNSLGRHFIRVYYRYSPKLVEMLRDKQVVNAFVRMLLNQIVKIISK